MTKALLAEDLKDRIGGLISAAHIVLQMHLSKRTGIALSVDIVGRSPHMIDVYNQVLQVAPHFRNALVTGPAGSGEELFAHALHRLSPASARPFVVCNCTALVGDLFESELFGYVKVAFTGAEDLPGLFEAADGGTLFLDEVEDIPFHLQGKLLRFLETNEIQRVGSRTPRKIDVRVIAAFNRDLREMMGRDLFRGDLFCRLSMVEAVLLAWKHTGVAKCDWAWVHDDRNRQERRL